MQVDEGWLAEFVDVPTPAELERALMAAGVEIESVEAPTAGGGAGIGADGGQASNGRRLHLAITPNRGDLLSHLGLAREIAAGSARRLLPATWRLLEQGPQVQTLCRLQVDEPDRARCYVGRVVRSIEVGPSPRWLADRLLAVGQRPINNVVDVSNYVMFELGVPLHAFDLAALAQEHGVASLHVRRARAGELLTTLDAVDRQLHGDDLLIADAAGPLALAGILGGARSQVTPATRAVWLEAACFAPAGIRASAKRHGLRTEASQRFSRGVDPKMAARAAARAAQLLVDVAGGEVASGALEAQAKSDGPKEILLRLAFVEKWLGVRLNPETIVSLLEPLQIRCARRTEAALVLAPPSFRFDLEREADLAEEIARRHGLDAIVERLPSRFAASPTVLVAGGNGRVRTGDKARRALLAGGVSECVHFAFAARAALAPFARADRAAVELLNPLGEEQRCLRTTLLPGLLATLQRNARRHNVGLMAFEIGTVWWQDGERAPALAATAAATDDLAVPAGGAHRSGATQRAWAKANREACDALLPSEDISLAVVLSGPRSPTSLYDRGALLEGPDLLAVWEAMLSAYGLDCAVGLQPGAAVVGPFNPYASASAWAKVPGRAQAIRLGQLGQLDPAYVREHVQASQGVYVMEVSLGVLEGLPRRALKAATPAKFPGTRRDIAIVAPKTLPAEQLRSFLAARAVASLPSAADVDVAIFDVYAGQNVPQGHVSLAFSLSYRGHSGTLTDEEVTPAFLSLLGEVEAAFGVTVRDGTKPAPR